MNGYKGYFPYDSGFRYRAMWFNGRRYIVTRGYDKRRWTYATVLADDGMHFSDDFANGHIS